MPEQNKNQTTQTTEFTVDAKDVLQYQNNKVLVKKAPLKGQNVAVYVRPGDDVVYEMENVDVASLDYRLVGGDIVVTMPNGGVFTFVSMALMGYSENPPSFFGAGGQKFTLGDVLSGVKEVNDLPFNSLAVEADIQYEDKVKKIIEDLEDLTRKLTKDVVLQQSFTDFASDGDDEGKKSTYQDLSTVNKFQEPIPIVIENPFTDYYSESYSRHFTSYIPTGGTVNDAAKPVFYFKATAHQTTYEETINDEGQIEILGGGGSINGYKFDSVTNQFEAETIDMSQRSEDMIIRAEGSSELTRVLRFEPQMPEGFYVDSFTLSGLPAGVTILDKDGNAITGSTLTKEQMIFKDALGNIISFDDADFLTNFKSAEFVIEYDATLATPFNVSITANYKLDDAYLETTDLSPSQSYTNQYTFALKDITSASDYTYKKTDFANGNDEGFILSKEPNVNIIKDGSGDNTIYGGMVQDTVYDAAGDDTVYLSAEDDTLYAGSGTNYIYGDAVNGDVGTIEYAGEDTVSYESVKSFASSEVKLLDQEGLLSTEESQKLNGTYVELDGDGDPIANSLDVDMLAYYKGVYVDLDGVHVDGLDIDVNGDGVVDANDKINVISKFADRVGEFTYDADGNALTTTLTTGGLENLQPVGYDILEDIENIKGSSYNDTIYGNALVDNILSGLGGSDTLYGRGGNNTLLGGDGYDTLLAGSGNDFIDGGADTDTVSYENATEGITIRFDRPNSEEFDYAGYAAGTFAIKDTIVNVEDIIGSGFADTIYGNGNTNFIEAGAGDDRILAGGGYDFIDGGAGSDWISYNPADYPNRVTNPTFMQEIQGITVDLNSTDFVMVKETTTNRLLDLIKSVEQIVATNGNDVIYGNNTSAETIWALDGNDRLESRGGNDTLYGGDGDDYIRAGAGLDVSWGGLGIDYLELYDDGLVAGSRNIRLSELGTIQYSTNSTNGVDGTWIDGYNANGGVNLAYEFEGFGGSSSADALYGNSQSNVLNGYGGNDTIYGFDGADTIRGGDGADTIYGGDGNDTIYGDQNNDIIDAGAGDDTVYGYGLYNSGTPNNDTIDGGTGTNTLNYTGTNNGFVLNMTAVEGDGYSRVDFSTGAIYDDLVKNFTKIIGSTGADTITANNSGMYLDGWSGTDKLYGGAGNDTIIARATSGEILDGNGGVDTLQLVQNVDLRNITVNDFETLDIQSYSGYLNLSQLSLNSFQTIKGSGNLYLYGTAGADNFDFGTIDFSGFSGKMYVYGYGGNDVYNFENATFNADASFYLDASSGTDTLKLGANQTLNMTDNYYNTFEDFDIGSDSTLNVTALNNSGRSFYANNKNFDGVDYLNDAQINFIGGTGNDIFYVDYTALRDGKLSIDGAGGSDIVDVRTALTSNSLIFDDANMFANIERLEFDQISNTNTIKLSANDFSEWIDGANLTLDIANNTQGTKITITDIQGGTDVTNFTVNSSYSVTPADDPSLSFTMAVV